MGLRELKKQITRQSIADAALQLTLEKGLDNVTIEEIARVAFVSPRTFSNHFSAKEEAVIAAGAQHSFAIVEAFAQRPASESPLQALCQLHADFARSQTPEQLRLEAQKTELVEQYPTLRPFQAAQYDRLEEAFRDGVAARTGTDVDADMYPWLVAAAAVAAVNTARTVWIRSGAHAEALPGLIETAFNLISDGLPAPPR